MRPFHLATNRRVRAWLTEARQLHQALADNAVPAPAVLATMVQAREALQRARCAHRAAWHATSLRAALADHARRCRDVLRQLEDTCHE